MRPAVPLGLVGLVLLAGCAGLVPGPAEPTTDQPLVRGAPAPPPGVDADGVSNVSALLAAHRRSLTAGGFALETETTRRGPAGRNVTVRETVVASRALRSHRHTTVRRFGGGRQVTQDRWAGASAARRVLENDTVVGAGGYDGADAAALTRSARLRWFLHRGGFELVAIRVQRSGARFVLEADGALPTGRGHLSARLIVTDEGRISSLVATITRPAEGGGLQLEAYVYRLRQVGDVTVERPGWVEDGRDGGHGSHRSRANLANRRPVR
jgi:hypothetical protein